MCFSFCCTYCILFLIEHEQSAEEEEKRYDETDFKGAPGIL